MKEKETGADKSSSEVVTIFWKYDLFSDGEPAMTEKEYGVATTFKNSDNLKD
jgi:hypothetical protein